jgi:CRISPR-associated protein Cmr3
VKRFIPSGGVYFFERVNGKASELADRWLEPVSDDEQDRRDGFGLAVWGIW